jgi:hypothetical protein
MNLHRSIGFGLLVTLLLTGARAAEGDNFVIWNWGSPDDIDPSKPSYITPPDRIGDVGADGDVKFRWVKANTYQVMLVMPVFDCDPSIDGAINHPFYLTIKFKDMGKKGTPVYTRKGGCGFYGAGPIGAFGGAGDGQWKEETLIIPRSMLRCTDGKTLQFKFAETGADVPVSSLTLFSAESKLPNAKEKIATAIKAGAAKREALRASLLPKFKDLGLPDPGPAPEFTAAEKERGFRVFFPPVHRQLFANSRPVEGELTDSATLFACPGQSVSLLAAIRASKDLGSVTIDWQDPMPQEPHAKWTARNAADEANRKPRWAVYSEQRIGSSWGTDYRVCPEQLVLGNSHEVKPERLEIIHAVVKIPPTLKAGDYSGTLKLTAEKGGKATFPIKLTVYPFTLDRPEHSTHGQFYYCEYGDVDPLEIEDMAEHGMDTLVGGLGAPVAPGADGKRNTQQTVEAFDLLKRHGYRAPLIDGIGYMNGMLADPKNRAKYAEILTETQRLARAAGFGEIGFFPVDEPHTAPLQAQAKLACEWTHDVPDANTYITSNPNAVKVLDPVLNYVCYNLTYLNATSIASMKAHQKLMFYCPSIDVNPEYNRYRPGYYMMKIAAYSSQYFAYMEFAADPFCDLDGPNRDWNVVYPSMESPWHDPTLEWEAMREGVMDYRYAYTLKTLAEQAKKVGKTAEAAKAQKVLDDILAVVDVDGNKAGGPAIAIEADVSKKDVKLDPKQLTESKTLLQSAWYEQSRRKIADAIIELKKAMK